MIPLSKARHIVLDACRPLETRALPIDGALGCVIARPVQAVEDVPPFVRSSMDGYAVRAADTPGGLAVVGVLMAGDWPTMTVGAGQAVRIMTGAPLPEGADAVCMVERTRPDGDNVVIEAELAPGTNVRQPGEDVAAGEVIVAAGTVLGAGHLGVLADQGIAAVEAWALPTVGVLSTGDELVEGPGPLAPGKIRDSNRHTLLAMVAREGWKAVDLGLVPDDEAQLIGVLERAGATCDAVVTSGGVSVGDLDVVRSVLERRSQGTMRWMQVAIKPAKPFAFGLLRGTPVFGLPGNPVSAMVSFELFVRPALRQMSGHRQLDRPVVPALAEADFTRRADGKLHLQRGRISLDEKGSWRVQPMAQQESHQLRAMADANALVLLPDGGGVRAGEPVDVLVLDLPTAGALA